MQLLWELFQCVGLASPATPNTFTHQNRETSCFFWNHNGKTKQMQEWHFFFFSLLQKQELGHTPVVGCSHEEAEEAALVVAQERAAWEEKPEPHESPGTQLSHLLSWSPLPGHGTAPTDRGSKPSPSRLAPSLAKRVPHQDLWVWDFSHGGINEKLGSVVHDWCLWGAWFCRCLSGKVRKPWSARFPEQSLGYRGAGSCAGPDSGPHSMKSECTSRMRAQWRFPGLSQSFKDSCPWKSHLH